MGKSVDVTLPPLDIGGHARYSASFPHLFFELRV
jgi:hypothetical protein